MEITSKEIKWIAAIVFMLLLIVSLITNAVLSIELSKTKVRIVKEPVIIQEYADINVTIVSTADESRLRINGEEVEDIPKVIRG